MHGDALVRGLEEVEGVEGDAHLSTELRRLGRERGLGGAVPHGRSTGRDRRVVAA